MDKVITRGILYGSHPPKGIFYQVVVDYDATNPMFSGKLPANAQWTTEPLESFPVAFEASEGLANKIMAEFGAADLTEVDPDSHDGYHFYLHDDTQVPVARIGIEICDYRHAKIH